MKKQITTKQITTTALLLALCIVFQCMKGLSVYLTGSAVNCILVIATLYCSLFSGTCIAILTPVVAYFIGATPIINMIPLMMFVIMIGNELIVLCVWLFRKKRLAIGMLLGSATKALFLWATVWFVVLPIFGAKFAGTDGGSRKDDIFCHTVCDGLHWQCDCMGDLQERI